LVAGGIEDSLEDNDIHFTIEQTLLLDILTEDFSAIHNEEKVYQKIAEIWRQKGQKPKFIDKL
jgi:hypothetical protein